ncbi:hypothetical protein N798_04255 [Knoellia flava TL1]|nr:hypothetical protein N798_04255 [Knoellia flava TL1]
MTRLPSRAPARRTARVVPLLALAAAAASATAGCGAGVLPGLTGGDPTSRLVVTWSESTAHSRADRDEWGDAQLRTRLVADDAQRRELLASLPSVVGPDERAPVEAVDLDEEVLVVGVYNKCTEKSHVERDGSSLRLVIERDSDTNCGWAPRTVDVWAVEREGLPTPITLRDQEGVPVPG